MKRQILISALAFLSLVACTCGKNMPCEKKVLDGYRPVVFFAFDSAELTSQAKATLKQMVEHNNDYSHQKVRITGYTDSTGSPEYNMKLGERRALAVQNYLLSLGIQPRQIEIVSDGENDPMATNSTAAGRAENRRAVVKFY